MGTMVTVAIAAFKCMAATPWHMRFVLPGRSGDNPLDEIVGAYKAAQNDGDDTAILLLASTITSMPPL